MHLVDTCGWIEWFSDGTLADKFRRFLEETDQLLVPTLVQYELFKWGVREKDESTALDLIAYTETCLTVPLDTNIALFAGDLYDTHRLSMADAVIYASARTYGVDLISSDAHFSALPHVVYWKK